MDFLDDMLGSQTARSTEAAFLEEVSTDLAAGGDDPSDVLVDMCAGSCGQDVVAASNVHQALDILADMAAGCTEDTLAVVPSNEPATSSCNEPATSSCAGHQQRRKRAGWGHWQSLTAEQRQLRGAVLRAGKARKQMQRQRASLNSEVTTAFDTMAVNCRVRASALSARIGRFRVKKLRFYTRRGRQLTLSPKLLLAIATTPDTAHSAKLHSVSRKTVRRVSACVADITLQLQSRLLQDLAGGLELHPPDWACAHLMWDETQEKLTLGSRGRKSGTMTLANGEECAWHILVSRLTFAWGWGLDHTQKVKVVLPAVPLASTGAESLWTLFTHPAFKDAWSFRDALFARAGISLELHSSDDASGNDRLDAHFKNVRGDLAERLKCRNHQVNLIEKSVYAAIGPDLLHSLFCSTMFVRSGSYFLRCMLAVRKHVHINLRVREGPAPVAEAALVSELADYLKTHHWRERKAHQSKRSQAQDHTCYEADVDECLGFLNGALHERSGKLVHYCCGTACCSSRAAAETRGIKAVCFLLQSKPCVPVLSRWTKVGPCLDFWIGGMIQGVMRDLLEVATRALSFEGGREPGDEDAAEEDGEGRVDFRVVAGKRLATCKRMLHSSSSAARLLLLAVLMEPLRHLHVYFLTVSGVDPDHRPAAICDLLDPAKSILTATLQWYSVLLHNSDDRMRLIWQLGGFNTQAELLEKDAALATLVRRCLLTASAGIARRHRNYLQRWPWPLFRLGDARCSLDCRREVAQAFVSQRSCCLPPGLARRLRERLAGNGDENAVDWLTGPGAAAFRGAARELKLSIAGVERLHSLNRARRRPQMRWHVMAAQAVHAERELIASTLQPPAVPLPPDPAQPAEVREGPLRKQTPLECFRK